MRVIAGSAKGHKLVSPKDYEGTRPILGRAKEALFDILQPRLPGCRFLDLFAGVGGVGIEAASRGAQSCVFVEVHDKPLRDLRQNLAKTGLDHVAEVVRADAFAYIASQPTPFDVVFASPPQWLDLWSRAVLAVDAHPELVAEDGIVVVHLDPREYRELDLTNLVPGRHRRYGNLLFCFYEVRA
ncbi:MAG: RsmD family RNA methyltransferase [Actinobacteria bacterium]|nr:RsmD family RNA methyltransferase [Actinomycetota bacterium]